MKKRDGHPGAVPFAYRSVKLEGFPKDHTEVTQFPIDDEKPRYLKYPDYRDNKVPVFGGARDCDLLLWEPTTWWGRCIAIATQGRFCHASAAVHLEGRLFQCGYEEGRDGVATLLGSEVDRYPGKISVFRVKNMSPEATAEVLSRLIDGLGGYYNWRGILLQIVGQFIVFKFLLRMSWYRKRARAFATGTAGVFCSQHIAKCFADSGFQFISKPFDEITPNDLGYARGAVDYIGTLYPNGDKK